MLKTRGYHWMCGAMLVGASMASATSAQAPVGDDRAAIRALAEQWMTAMDRQDRATLEKITGADFALHRSQDDTSALTSRREWIDGAMRRRWRHNGFENVDIDVRGDRAVMASTQNFAPPANGLKPNVRTSGPIVDIWEKQDGQWKVVSRYAGRWAFFEWIDRALGFIAGAVIFGLLGWMIGKRSARRRAAIRA